MPIMLTYRAAYDDPNSTFETNEPLPCDCRNRRRHSQLYPVITRAIMGPKLTIVPETAINIGTSELRKKEAHDTCAR